MKDLNLQVHASNESEFTIIVLPLKVAAIALSFTTLVGAIYFRFQASALSMMG